MKTKSILSALSCVFILSACGGEDMSSDIGQLEQAATVASPSASLKFVDAATGLTAVSFSISSVTDIDIYIAWAGLKASSAHVSKLNLYTPSGALYQSWKQSFAASKSGSGSLMIALPVAATQITDYNMVGKWTAKVYLDTAATPTAQASFNLQ